MNFLQVVAPVISASWTIGIVVAALVTWAGLSAWRLRAGTRLVCETLEGAAARLAREVDAPRFTVNFEAASKALADMPLLGHRWREYREALIVPSAPGRLVRATSRAEGWFDIGSLYRVAGVDGRYHAALPNLLVGAGLLFTFLGLAVALSTAGGIVAEGATQEQRNAELRALLDAASFKFITSLVGLFLSIVYALFRKHSLARAEASLDRFIAILDARVPLLTPAALQQEANHLLEKQGTQLETFSTELALNIGNAFDRAFDQRLGEHIAPLSEAMQALAANMASRNEDAMQRMLAAFIDQLQSGAGDRMADVSKALSSLASRLEGLQRGMDDAAARISQATAEMTARMGQETAASSAKLTTQFEGMLTELRDLAEASRRAGAASAEALSAQARQAAASFEATTASVAAAMEKASESSAATIGRGAEQAAGQLTAAAEQMHRELQAALADVSSSLRDAGDAMREAAGTALGSISRAVTEMSDGLRQAAKEAGAELARGGDAAGSRIDIAAGSLAQRAADLAMQLQQISEAAERIGTAVASLQRAVDEAAMPLVGSAADLKAAAQASQAATESLLAIMDGLHKAAERIGGAAESFEKAQAASLRLTEQLSETSAGFEQVDAALGTTLAQLQTGLKGFTEQARQFVVQTDENLAKAANSLGSATKQLEDTLGDFIEQMRAR